MYGLTVKFLTPSDVVEELWMEPEFFILDYPPDHTRLAMQVKNQLEENFKELDLCFELSTHIKRSDDSWKSQHPYQFE